MKGIKEAMLIFIVSLTYKVELQEADKVFPEHIAYIEKFHAAGKYIISGRREPRIGGVLIATNCSREEIEEIVRNDPYYLKGVADFEIIDLIPTRFYNYRLGELPPVPAVVVA
ncbi:YciI family protein [Pinirhizobacter soli]|uniref:YciI family protein n=1 Tax=Pinirhizobacter soli TaxID=2786953 RepID=UPI00202AA423|nr:YciI family protein [Pinirhizobacter soli]